MFVARLMLVLSVNLQRVCMFGLHFACGVWKSGSWLQGGTSWFEASGVILGGMVFGFSQVLRAVVAVRCVNYCTCGLYVALFRLLPVVFATKCFVPSFD